MVNHYFDGVSDLLGRRHTYIQATDAGLVPVASPRVIVPGPDVLATSWSDSLENDPRAHAPDYRPGEASMT